MRSLPGPKETGFEPPCGHCGKRCLMYKGIDIGMPKKLEKQWFYFCRECKAACEVIGLKPVGTPARKELRALRASIKRRLWRMVERKAFRDGISEIDAFTKASKWIEEKLGIFDYDANRLNADQARRLDALLEEHRF